MSTARKIFRERLVAYKTATEAELIISKAPVEVAHNATARLFRNGLAVVGYAIIEDFIKSRTEEVLHRIGSGTVSFIDLPEGIKIAATSGVLNAMKFQERHIDRKSGDAFKFYQKHARAVASTDGTAYEISSLAFANDQSNLSSSSVEGILTAFCVEKPWNAIGSIASRCGVGSPDLKSVFDNAAKRRHIAAHQASADIETNDLIGFTGDIAGLAVAFDLLISFSLRRILNAESDFLAGKTKTSGNQIIIRKMEFDGSKCWRELAPPYKKAFKRSEDFEVLKSECITRARTSAQAVVVIGQRGFPEEWSTPNVD